MTWNSYSSQLVSAVFIFLDPNLAHLNPLLVKGSLMNALLWLTHFCKWHSVLVFISSACLV